MSDFQTFFERYRPQPGYCLILRPFDESADKAWSEIKRALELDFRLTDVKDLSASGAILDQILVQLARTDVVIFDITGSNPNVFFELGVAKMAKAEDKIIILNRGDPSVPFDVRPDRYLSFKPTKSGIKAMLPELKRRISDALEESQWFLVAKGSIKEVGPLETSRSSAAIVEVRPIDFLQREMTGKDAPKVNVEVTIRGNGQAVARFTETLGAEASMAMGDLPWRLKFHKFEGDKAHFCVESIRSKA